MALQPDGKILVGGEFSTLGGGSAQRRIGRLDASGVARPRLQSRRERFIYTFAVQPGGQILVGGAFTTMGGGGLGLTPRNRIARLNADGSLDPTFDPGANDWVLTTGHAAGWADPGRRQLLHAGRRRDRHDVPQPDRRLNPTAPSMPASIRARTLRPGDEPPGGWEDPGRRRLHDPGRRRDRQDAAYLSGRLRPTACSIRLLTLPNTIVYAVPGAAGREDPGRRQLHHAEPRVEYVDAKPDRAAQRRRLARRQLQSGRGRYHLRHGGAGGWKDRGRRRLLGAGRRAPQPIWRGSRPTDDRRSFNPGAKDSVYALAVQPDGRFWSAATSRMLGGGDSTRRRKSAG